MNLINEFSLIKIDELNVKFETLFPEYEYLIRCNWLTEDVIWAQLLNRHQNHLVIVFVSITNKFPAQIIYEEYQKSHWYNCHDILHFNKNYSNNKCINVGDKLDCDFDGIITVGSKVEFLWSSEKSGFRHLYKILIEIVDYQSASINKVETDSNSNEPMAEILMDEIPLHSLILENKQMTSGNWEISDSMLWVDEKNELIYFIGNKESPLEYHLYVIPSNMQSYDNISPIRLSEEDFTHTRVVFDPKFKFCIDFQSNVSIPTFSYLHKIVNNNVSSVNTHLEPLHIFQTIGDDFKLHNSLNYYNTFLPDLSQHMGSSPQIFEYRLKSGELIYGFLFKPDYMKAGIKYPVLLEIYGGPEVQIVTKSFKSKYDV